MAEKKSIVSSIMRGKNGAHTLNSSVVMGSSIG